LGIADTGYCRDRCPSCRLTYCIKALKGLSHTRKITKEKEIENG